MEKSKSNRLSLAVRTVLATCLTYCLLDLPLRLSGAYDFPAGIGVKSFLPYTCALFLGLWGTLGCVLGALLDGLLARASGAEILAECVCVLLAGMGSRHLWFAANRDGNARFERWRDIGVYAAATAAVSLACGAVSALLAGTRFLPTAFGYLLAGLLVGLLVNILLGGVFCVEPVLPRYCRAAETIAICLTPQEFSSDAVNELIEEEALARKIPMKRTFEIENCLEELYIRIRRKLPDAEVRGSVALGSAISMRLCVRGEKYDPFRAEEGEDELDLAGLKLLRHRALRASYSYAAGENRIHVVV